MTRKLRTSGESLMLVSLVTVPERAAPIKVDAAEYLYLAEIVARKFYRGNEPIRDTELYSIACQELVRISSEYRPEVNEDFTRFAFRAMKNAILDHIRYKKAKKRTAAFEPLSDRQWQDLPDEQSETPDCLPIDLLRTLLGDHPDDTDQDRADKTLLEEIYLQGKKVPVIEQYGISRVTVYNRLRRILGKIQERHAELIETYGGVVDECDEREPCRLHGRCKG